MRRPCIVSLGEVLWDLFPEGARFGGAPANFACHAAILGAEVSIVSAIGDDRRGREAIGILDQFGINTSLMQVIPDVSTGTVGVETDQEVKPRFTIHEKSAWDQLDWAPEFESKISRADAVYFGTLGQRGKSSRATIRRALDITESSGVLRILDINLRAPFFDDELIRESISRTSILKLSDDELEAVVGACGISIDSDLPSILRTAIEKFGIESIVMTRGAEGALFVSADEVVDQRGVPAEIVDTVGAGDAFTAAFVLGLLRGEAPEANVRNACETAATVCSHPGAIPVPVQ